MRSISASSGSSAAQTDAHSSAPCTSPDGEETATSASSSRARAARDLGRRLLHPRVHAPSQATRVERSCPSCPRWRSPPGGWPRRCRARRSSRRWRPGINALKTFDPPLHALDGATFTGVRRRGKLLLLDVETGDGPLTLLMHLMSAGRLQLYDKRALAARPHLARAARGCPSDRELRLREFGTKQAAWVKVLRAGGASRPTSRWRRSGPEAWPDPPELRALLDAPRPLHSLLRDQQVIAGIGRTWVDEILHAAQLSPFKRGDDLSEEEAERAARGDGLRARPRARPLRGAGRSCRCRRSSRSRRGSTPTRASRARAAGPRSRRSSTRTT